MLQCLFDDTSSAALGLFPQRLSSFRIADIENAAASAANHFACIRGSGSALF